MWMFIAIAFADPTSRFARVAGDPLVTAYPDQAEAAHLVVDCVRRKPKLYLEVPFAPDIAGTYEDAYRAEIQVRLDLNAAETLRVRTDKRPGALVFPKVKRWLARFATAETIEITYTPFASPPTFTRFSVAEIEGLVGEISTACGV